MYKMNSKTKMCLRELESGEYFKTQSNNFEIFVAKNITSSQLNTLIETCRNVGNRNNQTVAVEMSQIQQDKILDEGHSILCLQRLTARHRKCLKIKIICCKNENVLKYIIAHKIAETGKYKNK